MLKFLKLLTKKEKVFIYFPRFHLLFDSFFSKFKRF